MDMAEGTNKTDMEFVTAHRTISAIFSLLNLTTAMIGSLANLASIYVFSQRSMRRCSINRLLGGLALFDLALLLTDVPTFSVPPLLDWLRVDYNTYQAITLKFVYPICMMSQTCSVLTIVAITIERWVAVCRPLEVNRENIYKTHLNLSVCTTWSQVKQLCSVQKAMLTLLVIVVVGVGYNTIRFWEYSIERDDAKGIIVFERQLRNVSAHPSYYIFYFTCSYLLTHFLVPFLVIAWLNAESTLVLLKMRQERKNLTRQERGERRTTVMMLLVTGSFAVCNTLPFLLNIVEALYKDVFHNHSTMLVAYLLMDLSNWLVVLNSSTTALICFGFSQKYRKEMQRLWKKLTGKNRLWPGKSNIYFYTGTSFGEELFMSHYRPGKFPFIPDDEEDGEPLGITVRRKSRASRRRTTGEVFRKTGRHADQCVNRREFHRVVNRKLIAHNAYRKQGIVTQPQLRRASSASEISSGITGTVTNGRRLCFQQTRRGSSIMRNTGVDAKDISVLTTVMPVAVLLYSNDNNSSSNITAVSNMKVCIDDSVGGTFDVGVEDLRL